MVGFLAGLGFLIRILGLLFTWAAVAIFISPELAALMGYVLIGLWILMFMPYALFSEIRWQAKSHALLKQTIQQAPVYQAGTALPPPPAPFGNAVVARGQATTGGSGAAGSAIDIFRELPELPRLPERTHAKSFRRGLVLPIVGILMVWGSYDDSLTQSLMQMAGVQRLEHIAYDRLRLPPALQNDSLRNNMHKAARLALRRETACTEILAGTVEAAIPLPNDTKATAEIAAGHYRFVFTCPPRADDIKKRLLTIWVTPDDLQQSLAEKIRETGRNPLIGDLAVLTCRSAAIKSIAALGGQMSVMPQEIIAILPSELPFRSRSRILTLETIYRNSAPIGQMELNCYLKPSGEPEVRLTRAAP